MHRIVANCFKAIAYSMIFIIIWTVGFYLWKVNALNQRIESLTVSMQNVVSRNNYLPEDSFNMFSGILQSIASDMNGGDKTDTRFIYGMWLNYDTGKDSTYSGGVNAETKLVYDSIGTGSKTSKVCYNISAPVDYGDVQVIELEIGVNAPWFSSTDRADKITISGKTLESSENHQSDMVLKYTYAVPCLKYTTVTQ